MNSYYPVIVYDFRGARILLGPDQEVNIPGGLRLTSINQESILLRWYDREILSYHINGTFTTYITKLALETEIDILNNFTRLQVWQDLESGTWKYNDGRDLEPGLCFQQDGRHLA